jgi:hypothetical protein
MTRYRNVIAGVAVFSAALALGAQVNAQMTTPESQGQQRGGGQRRTQTPAASAEAAARVCRTPGPDAERKFSVTHQGIFGDASRQWWEERKLATRQPPSNT